VQAASSPRTLQALLDAAAARIARLEPIAALTAIRAGGLLIDIRSEPDRERDGIVPSSVHIPRTVLEWRLAPDSLWRSPHVGDLDQQIILMCDHGCSSILAAATLVDLGFTRAGDVIGGFAAWRGVGLPTVPPRATDRAPGELPGMRGPDN
jgi:rhodanese-related sulfurtransferase